MVVRVERLSEGPTISVQPRAGMSTRAIDRYWFVLLPRFKNRPIPPVGLERGVGRQRGKVVCVRCVA
jgi:hypothetical protein